jgi:FMN phosphatase YigB (HAD superfamily)
MAPHDLVHLVDVDNTLLDNDTVTDDLRAHLRKAFGDERQRRYWDLFEELRGELGYADYLGALQRYRKEFPHDPHIMKVSCYLLDYPFDKQVCPKAFAVLRHCRRWGRAVIVSDGDAVFQPHKIEVSGLARAVRGAVLIYVHKDRELRDVARQYPAQHYVFVDDKPHLIARIKMQWKDRVTTVFVEQGHYGRDPKLRRHLRHADLRVKRIGDLLKINFGELVKREAGTDKKVGTSPRRGA